MSLRNCAVRPTLTGFHAIPLPVSQLSSAPLSPRQMPPSPRFGPSTARPFSTGKPTDVRLGPPRRVFWKLVSDPVFANYEQARTEYKNNTRTPPRATWQGMIAAATVMLRNLGSPHMATIVDLEARRMEVMEMPLGTEEQRETYRLACNEVFEAQMQCIAEMNDKRTDQPTMWMRCVDLQANVEHGPEEKPVEIGLRKRTSVHARPVRSTDPQGIEKFLLALGPASYAYRFPQHPGSRGKLADAIVYGSSHPGERNYAAVVEDEKKSIVGLVDYRQRVTPCSELDVCIAKEEGLTPPDLKLRTCEVNLVLADALHRQGVAPQFVAHAIESARTDGYEQMIAVVDDTNEGICKVLAGAGFGPALPMTGGLPGYHRYVIDLRTTTGE